MKSVSCNQPFVFGPSRRYVSKLLIELPILVTRLDGKEDVLTVQTYLADAEVPFLCEKQTLEIHLNHQEDSNKKQIKMIDTTGGHYGIILETRKRQDANMFLVEDDSGILFVQDEQGDLCSFKSVRKVHQVNRHKCNEQFLAAYRNDRWMSLELACIVERVVNDCKVCQKFKKLVVRLRVTLPKSTSFNEVVTPDLKDFENKYVLWMIDSFSRFMVGKLLNNKTGDTIIQVIMD